MKKPLVLSALFALALSASAFALPCDEYESLIVGRSILVQNLDDGSNVAQVAVSGRCDTDGRGFYACPIARNGASDPIGLEAIGLEGSRGLVSVAFMNTRTDRVCGFEIVGDGRGFGSGGSGNINNIFVLSIYRNSSGKFEITGSSRRPGAAGIRVVPIR